MRHLVSIVMLLATGLLLAAPCVADRLQVPLTMDRPFIESLVREQVFTGPGSSVRMNDDGTGCQFLELREPRIGTVGGRVRLRTNAEARAGRAVGDRCILVLNWRGQLELDQQASISADGKSVVLRTESWRALTPDGQTDTLSTTIGRWLEQFLPLNLRETRISLVQPLAQFKDFLALIMAGEDAARLNVVLDSIAFDSVAARDDGVTVMLSLDVVPVPAPAPVAEPELTNAELAELETRLDALDAFVTYTIKELTTSPVQADTVNALFDVLLDLRIELIEILAEPRRGDLDPVRLLFVSAWDRLTPILRAIAGQQANHDSAVRYLTFIGAGDLLRALDRLGPAAGIDVSSDGLRRLARILVPDDTADPLQYDDDVDPDLRKSLGFGEPLPPPQSMNETSWLDWIVRPASAADRLDGRMVKKLNNWVPRVQDMEEYLPMVRDVLQYVVTEQLKAKELDRSFREIFRRLVFTAAWQESCWRQFVAKKNKRVPLESGTGDIGMMQINPKVWRGFYDTQGLKWDIVYNARAGADILQHHMINYAIEKREHKTTGKADNLARSAYAAYNGGPRQYDRYRRKNAPAAGKKADALFWEKYRVFSSGKELGVRACFQGLK